MHTMYNERLDIRSDEKRGEGSGLGKANPAPLDALVKPAPGRGKKAGPAVGLGGGKRVPRNTTPAGPKRGL